MDRQEFIKAAETIDEGLRLAADIGQKTSGTEAIVMSIGALTQAVLLLVEVLGVTDDEEETQIIENNVFGFG